jgi:hypothetical protein
MLVGKSRVDYVTGVGGEYAIDLHNNGTNARIVKRVLLKNKSKDHCTRR